MSDDNEFRIRPGRIRSTRAQQARPFVAPALAAAQKAGGRGSRSGKITSGKLNINKDIVVVLRDGRTIPARITPNAPTGCAPC